MFRFVVGIRDAPDIFENHFWRGGGHDFGSREVPKEGGGDHIHPFVRTLGGQDHGDKQLIRIVVMQLRLGNRHIFVEPVQNTLISFLFTHILFH